MLRTSATVPAAPTPTEIAADQEQDGKRVRHASTWLAVFKLLGICILVGIVVYLSFQIHWLLHPPGAAPPQQGGGGGGGSGGSTGGGTSSTSTGGRNRQASVAAATTMFVLALLIGLAVAGFAIRARIRAQAAADPGEEPPSLGEVVGSSGSAMTNRFTLPSLETTMAESLQNFAGTRVDRGQEGAAPLKSALKTSKPQPETMAALNNQMGILFRGTGFNRGDMTLDRGQLGTDVEKYEKERKVLKRYDRMVASGKALPEGVQDISEDDRSFAILMTGVNPSGPDGSLLPEGAEEDGEVIISSDNLNREHDRIQLNTMFLDLQDQIDALTRGEDPKTGGNKKKKKQVGFKKKVRRLTLETIEDLEHGRKELGDLVGDEMVALEEVEDEEVDQLAEMFRDMSAFYQRDRDSGMFGGTAAPGGMGDAQQQQQYTSGDPYG